MEKITTDVVLYHVSHPNSKEELQKQALSVRKEIGNLNNHRAIIRQEIMETVQCGVRYDDTGGSHGSGTKKDLSNVLEITERMLESQLEELYAEYQNIIQQTEVIHRLHIVVDTLSPLAREILQRLYVENQKWEHIEYDLKISRRKIASIRKNAINEIQDRFNSELSNMQLVKQKNTSFWEKSKKESKPAVICSKKIAGQLTLDMLER